MGSIGLTALPRLVPMVGIIWGRVLGLSDLHSLRAGKSPEVIVERVILFDDDHNMINQSA
jgi:hypothetical protein